MNFCSQTFVIFLATVLLAFYAAPPRARKLLILAASYVFYGFWSIPFIAVILASTSIDYFLSKAISTTTDQLKRKAMLATGICVNLAILGYFKYADFLWSNALSLAQMMHMPVSVTHLNVLLPLGISFYTFEAISYLVDVYRGLAPAPSFLQYHFYIMFFPHLVSGPIVRFQELSSQIENNIALPNWNRIVRGVELILLGFIFKCLFADPVSAWADPVFKNPAAASAVASYIGVLAFTAQIYFDFLGYTHIARGVSLLFNIELPLNFNHPYNARNISEFWQRWHITLSRWIRDYLYIPIGGSRRGAVLTFWNLMITMLIAGAWHGAGWTFVAWGAYHGALLAIYHTFGSVRDKFKIRVPSAIAVPVTFVCASLGWVLFRAHSISDAGIVIGKLSKVPELCKEIASSCALADYTSLLRIVVLIAICTSGPLAVHVYEKLYVPLPRWVKVQFASTALLLCWILSSNALKPFIYFQF